jgi:uncharacterized protein involved in cysteine biosynthesis
MEPAESSITSQPPVASRSKEKAMGNVRSFFMGLAAPFHGLKFLLTHRSLIPYAVVPFLINVTVTLFLLAVLLTSAVGIFYWIHGMPFFATSGWHRAGEVLLDIAILALLLGMTAASYMLLGGILSAFFNERLAKQVEILLGTPADQLQEAPLKQQAIDGVRNFLTVAATSACCLLLGCIPLLNLLGAAISFYVDWFVYGYEYFEMPMSLRGMPRKSRRAFARQHRPKVLGLGATVFCLGLIPIVGSVFLTTAAVGSVLMYHKLPAPGAEQT